MLHSGYDDGDVLRGQAGHDVLIAGSGLTCMYGGEGDDTFLAWNGVFDYIDGGESLGDRLAECDEFDNQVFNVEVFGW